MRLIKLDGENLVFQLSKREKRLLLDLLKLYPLIPAWHHRATRSGKAAAAKPSQKLLDEALAEQRRENKQQLEAMLADEGRFKTNSHGCELSLNACQSEWLLQVLNDIRVGSWLILGEPDEKKGKSVTLTPENAQYLWSMEMCGYFEAVLLHALDAPGLA